MNAAPTIKKKITLAVSSLLLGTALAQASDMGSPDLAVVSELYPGKTYSPFGALLAQNGRPKGHFRDP